MRDKISAVSSAILIGIFSLAMFELGLMIFTLGQSKVDWICNLIEVVLITPEGNGLVVCLVILAVWAPLAERFGK